MKYKVHNLTQTEDAEKTKEEIEKVLNKYDSEGYQYCSYITHSNGWPEEGFLLFQKG